MSKYKSLWNFVKKDGRKTFVMTFDEIAAVCGMPVDHSFLNVKNELIEYGYSVGKISLKQQTITFNKIEK